MSEIRATTISDAAGTGPATLTGQYAAKAWANINGTGTVAIRESANVSSVTDIGTGDCGVSFASALTDANYSITAWCNAYCYVSGYIGVTLSTTGVTAFHIQDAANTATDVAFLCFAVTR